MKYFLLVSLFITSVSLTAQTTLLDPVTHPKFQNPVPVPSRINLNSAGTNVFEMAQFTKWLGLVNTTNNSLLNTPIWGFGPVGAPSYPGPTLVANSGVPVNVEWRNNLPATHLLPVDPTYHKAVTVAGTPAVVHLHGGHSEAASDGQPESWYTPNYAEKGATWVKNVYTYENSQEGSMLWYHDHTLGLTRLNVYAGLTGMYLLNDANDQALSLPRGNYEKEMIIQDKSFDNTGKLFYPSAVPAGTTATAPSGIPEFFGDFILVNGMVWPFMNVEPRKYRFRLVNGSDSRVYTFAFSNGASFSQIGTDDGKLNTPSVKTSLNLAPGERADVIVDFTNFVGQQITLLNNGPDGPFGNPASPPSNPATTGQVMQFRVNIARNTAVAEATVTNTTNLRPLLGAIPAMAASNVTRKLALFEGTDEFGRILPMLGIVDPTNLDNGSLYWHMPTTENVNLNDTETWEIYNTTMDAHPIHLHLVAFQVINREAFTFTTTPKDIFSHNGLKGVGAVLSTINLSGTPTNFVPNDNGWKDTYVVQPGEVVRLKARFDKAGDYVWHCHILSHEDHDMMRRITVSAVGGGCTTDVTPPVLSACPTNINLTTTGTTTLAAWTAPTATDNCSTPSVSFTTSPNTGLTNGGAFPIGTTAVNYMAMDAKGNMSTCSFTVTVTTGTGGGTDICASPTTNIVAGSNSITVSGITTSSAIIQVFNNLWTTVYNQQVSTSSATIPNLAAGTYSVKVTVLGAGGKWPATCVVQQLVTVSAITNNCTTDATPPVLTACPSNLNLTTTGTTASASWTAPTATDNCSTPSVSFTTSPTTGLTNGGAFPIGTTNVDYMAMDAKGNMSMCSFTVTVTTGTGGGGGDICANPIANIVAGSNSIALSGITTSSAIIQVFNNLWTTVYNQQVSTSSVTIPNLTAGIYSVKVTVLGAGGKWPATCVVQQLVTVSAVTNNCTTDVTPPILSACPTNINLTTTGTTALASWTAPTATDNCSTPSVSFTTSPTTGLTNGSTFPIGATTVSYMAMDAKGNMSTCSFTVTVSLITNNCTTDVTPPVLSACPTNINLTTTGTTALASWTAPTATDNCSTPSVSFTTSPTTGLTNGGAFPIGATTVTYMAMDAKGNMSTCSFTVNVTTGTVGGSDICANPVANLVAGSGSITVSGITTSSAIIQVFNNYWTSVYNQQVSTSSATIPSLTAGTYSVKVTVLGAGGKWPALCTVQQFVTVSATTNPCATDVTPPVLSACPSNISLTTTGATALASWTAPTATDNCSTANVTFTTSPTTGLTNGGAFPIGVTTVNYMAMDVKGNMSICSFKMTVSNTCITDYIAPVLSACPKTMNLSSSVGTQIVSWVAPTATDNCSTPSVFYTTSPIAGLTNGGLFPTGITRVTYKATDAKNNTATCYFDINIADLMDCKKDGSAPVFFGCPTNMILNTTGNSALAIWNEPTPFDNCSTPSIKITTSPTKKLINGDYFPIGTTTVSYEAKDSKKNVGTCVFDVTVKKSYALLAKTVETLQIDATAQPTRTFITWMNNTGFKNDYFAVEKWNDVDNAFKVLEVLDNKSLDNSSTFYMTYDNAPNVGDNIYRIKLTQTDGTIMLSETKTVNFKDLSSVRVYPNPTDDYLNIDLMPYKNQSVEIGMYNTLGQEMSFKKIEKVENTLIQLDVSEFKNGSYIMSIKANGKREINKSVIILH
jgi:spore coat protein A, manganese oxidase